MYNWKARIGFICPSVIETPALEFYQIVPKGFSFAGVSLNIDHVQLDEVKKANAQIDRAVKDLVDAKVDMIVLGGAPIQYMMGDYPYDQELVKRIEDLSGLPATTDMTAVLTAMKALKMKKVVIASPNADNLHVRMRKYVEDAGIKVLALKGLQLTRNSEIASLPDYASYRTAREVLQEAPEADGIYMPCARWPVCLNIDALERDTQKPVVASVQAWIWVSMRRLGFADKIEGYGRLFNL